MDITSSYTHTVHHCVGSFISITPHPVKKCCLPLKLFSNHMQRLQLLLLNPPNKLPARVEKTCVLAVQYQMTCSPLKVLVSVPGPALPLRVRDVRSHRLGVGVANAHFIVILRVDAHIPSPQLARSHALISVDLPTSNSKNCKAGCVWSQRIL